MASKPVEFVDVAKITGRTVLADGTICLDIVDGAGGERCLKFKPSTYEDVLSVYLPSAPMATPRSFAPLAVESRPSAAGSRQIRFLLSPATAICIQVDSDQVAALQALLGDVFPEPSRAN